MKSAVMAVACAAGAQAFVASSQHIMARHMTEMSVTAVVDGLGGEPDERTAQSATREPGKDSPMSRSLFVRPIGGNNLVRGLDVRDGALTPVTTASGSAPPPPPTPSPSEDSGDEVGDCILLFGAFCNGNMGDVIQAIAMENLISSVSPTQCLWYAHPWQEERVRGKRRGQFFGRNPERLIHLTTNHAEQVNRFKALVIGGGGLFVAQHTPLNSDVFTKALTLPIIIMGVGASYHAKGSATLIKKASFLSGRDTISVKALRGILKQAAADAGRSPKKLPRLKPDDVEVVRDPILSDTTFTDTNGTCWRQSEGNQQPLCFILPASNSESTIAMHKQLVTKVVRKGDVLINVFPKHQKEIEEHGYPEKVLEILDPVEFKKHLCSCSAIVSTRLHGAILGLHMGVPTFGASIAEKGNKVPELMINVMKLPQQFFVIDERLTRDVVDHKVELVKHMYSIHDDRAVIHARLSGFHEEFTAHARHALFAPVEERTATPKPGEAGRLDGLIAYADKVRDYLATAAVLVATLTLALLSSRGDPRWRGFRGIFSTKKRERKEGPTNVQKDVSPAYWDNRNFETGASSEPRSMPVRGERVAPGVTTASSKKAFVLNFVVWVSLAMGFNGYGKSYLRDTRDPVGLLVLQGVTGVAVLSTLGCLGVVNLSWVKGSTPAATRQGWLAAILHTNQALMTNVVVLLSGVAVTNALKAMEPVAAAMFSYIFIGKKTSGIMLVALTAIMGGIVLLTSSGRSRKGETGGDVAVMASAVTALAAVCCNALRNVVIKKGRQVSPHQTLLECSVAAAFFGFVLLTFRVVLSATSVRGFLADGMLQHENFRTGLVHINGLNAALCFVGYNFASFNLLVHLSPVGHAVGNSIKRMLVFASGLVFLGEAMLARQLVGAAIALGGVLAYNITATL